MIPIGSARVSRRRRRVDDAIPDGLVDNFELAQGESGAGEPYGVWLENEDPTDRYPHENGQSGTYEFITPPDAVEGDRVLMNNTDGGLIVSSPGDGLNYYPQKGDIFEARLNSFDTGSFNNPQFIFGSPASSDRGYYIIPNTAQSEFRISLDGDGGSDAIASDSLSIPNGEWLRIEVEWHDGSGSESDNEIVARLFDESGTQLSSISVNDSTHENERGVGWGNGGPGDEVRFDNAKLIGHVGSSYTYESEMYELDGSDTRNTDSFQE